MEEWKVLSSILVRQKTLKLRNRVRIYFKFCLASWSHGSQLLRGEDAPAAIGEGILRLSIGVENADDLIADFERALSLV